MGVKFGLFYMCWLLLLIGYCVLLIFEGRKFLIKNIGLENVGVELDKIGVIKVRLFIDVLVVL